MKWNWVPSFIGEWNGAREIEIDEHVIIESDDPTKHNFEARLLTPTAKKMLMERNDHIIRKYKADRTKVLMAAKNGLPSPSLEVKHANWWFKCDEDHDGDSEGDCPYCS